MEKLIFTQEEFENAVHEAVMKERHILFDLCLEDYGVLPEYAEIHRRGKAYIIISQTEWKEHLEQIGSDLGDLATAREIIKAMYPVYCEYQKEYEKAHAFNMDEYILFINTAYDSEEFERVRDLFEEHEWLPNIDDELER